MANEFIARKGLIALDNSGISGSLDVSGSLTIESSGSTLFEVVGSEGQLFSITDSLSGSLFAVSDVSGLPILEVFSDDTVKIGTFNNESLIVGGTNVTASNLLASDVTISHTPSSSPTSLAIGNPPHLVHTIEIASGSTNVMRFASNTGNGGQHTIGFSGHTGANSMQTAIIGQAQGASGRVDLYFALASGDNVTATTSDAKMKITTSETTIYNNVHAQADTFEIGGSNTGDSILYLGDEKRTGIARDYRGAGNAADFVVMTMGSLGGTSVPTTHTRLRVTKEGDTEISGSLTASQNVDIQGTLSLPGFTNVSASLAAAVAGGDDLGSHTATQDLNMGGNAITNVGNVDGVDVSTLKSDFDTLEGKTLVSSSAQTVANLDGQNVTVSSLTVKNSSTGFLLKDGTGTSTYVNFSPQGGLYINPGGVGNSISASSDITTHGDFIGESTHIKLIGPDGGGGSFTYLSSSGDPAAGNFKLSLGDIDGQGNTTGITIDDGAEQVQIEGSITVTGTVDGVDVSALNSTVSTNTSNIATLTAATSSYLTTVDISDDTNLTAGNGITLTGDTLTVTAGTGLTQNAGGLAFDADGGTLTTNNADVDHILINDGGVFKRITKGNINVGDFNNNAGYTTNTGTVTSVGGTGTVSGLSLSGTVTTSGNLTLGGIISISSTNITDVDAFSQTGTYASLRAQGTTAGDVGLGNVTNESKATMFTSPTFTGTTAAPTPSTSDDSTKIATTAYVQANLDNLIGNAGAALDTLGELSASLADATGSIESLVTEIDGKLAKSSNLSDLTNAATARTNLGVDPAGTDNSTDVTLAGSYDYITISGQQITRNQIDASTDISNLTTTNVSEGTNEYYTDAKVKTKLNTENVVSGSATQVRSFLNVEDGADVTDTANVTAAGALMDSEVDADIKTLSLPANTTISTFGASLIDDTTAAAARTTLGVDAAGTDNSTDVTLTGTPDYITISGQTITRNQIDLTTDVTGQLPAANLGTITSAKISDVDAFSQTGTYASLRAQGTTAGDVGLGNVTNESKTTMFTSPTFTGTVAIPGFSDVSASLAAAVAGGDNLGNHTATQNLDMGTYAITNVGNVDGVDVSTLKSDFDTLEGKTLVSGSAQIDLGSATGTAANASTASYVAGSNVDGIVASATLALSAVNSTNASNIDVNNVSGNTEYGLVFRDGNGDGNQALYADNETDQPSYNPSTNTIKTPIISASSALYVGGNITVTGTVDGVDVSALNSTVSTNTTNISTLTAATSSYLTSETYTGTVDTSGTPADGQLAIFTDSNTIEGTSTLSYSSLTNYFNIDTRVDIDYSTNSSAVVDITNNNNQVHNSTDHYALRVVGGQAVGTPGGQNKAYGGHFTAGNTNATNPDSIALYAQGHEDGAPNSYAAIFSGSAGGVVGINIMEPTVELDVVGDGKFSGTLEIGGISDVSASIAAAAASGGGGGAAFPYTGSAGISGSLEIVGSGSNVFNIEGSLGQLFSVSDNFSGSLFKVATISGTPVLEAFSDNVVKIGAFNNEAIIVDGSTAQIKASEQVSSGLSSVGDYGAGAEITYLGSSATSTTIGKIYYYTGTTWAAFSSATESHQQALLGIALGSTMASGFLLKGFVYPSGASITAGRQVFGATNASITGTAPTSGFQRVMGHSISTTVIYFNPSQEYLDLA